MYIFEYLRNISFEKCEKCIFYKKILKLKKLEN